MAKRLSILVSILMILAIAAACVPAPAPAAPAAQQPAAQAEQPAAQEEQPADQEAGAPKRIGVTMFTRAHVFYQQMEETWTAEAPNYNFELILQSADTDVALQTSQIENFIQQQVDAIILCAVDPQGIIPAIEKANAAGIPVITVDGPAEGGDVITFIGTDNTEGGKIAGEFARQYITEELGGNANVAILDYPQSAVVAVARVNGFKSALEGMPGVNIVAQQDGGAMRDKSMTVMENVLSANPDIDVVFGINDETIIGAMAAATAAGRADDMIFIGYDATPETVDTLIGGDTTLMAEVAQQPALIAKTSLDVLRDIFAGEEIPETMPVPPMLVTPENAQEFKDSQS